MLRLRANKDSREFDFCLSRLPFVHSTVTRKLFRRTPR
jgi:hypothetical protein